MFLSIYSLAPMVQGKSGEVLGERLWSELMTELAFADPEKILEGVKM